MKYTLVATMLICLTSPALADPSADAKADAIRECILGKIGGHEAFGKAAPSPHKPKFRPDGELDPKDPLGYGNRRPQPGKFVQEPTVTHQELQHAASQCRHENP